MNQTLLPTGCYDILPPYARLESKLDYQLLSHFESYGYEQVAPPLLEYASSLLTGRGRVLSQQVIRVMDPDSQKVMGLRADMTLQMDRIASGRMDGAKRPLRLCYSGPILRIQGQASAAKRQMQQTGIELIGAIGAQADAEVILIAVRALQSVGIGHITIDLNFPAFVGFILSESLLDNDEIDLVFKALAHKDSSRLKQFNEPACDMLCELMLMSGNATKSLAKLKQANLPESVAPCIAHLDEVIAILDAQKGEHAEITLDVTERGGLDYYSGISFAIFATEKSVELGRGGRYTIDHSDANESAIGFTSYTDSLLDLMPKPTIPTRVYVEQGIAEADLAKLHDQGYVTILALEDTAEGDVQNTARACNCDFVYQSGELEKIEE